MSNKASHKIIQITLDQLESYGEPQCSLEDRSTRPGIKNTYFRCYSSNVFATFMTKNIIKHWRKAAVTKSMQEPHCMLLPCQPAPIGMMSG